MAKNLFKKISAIALTAVGAASLSFGVAGCARKSTAKFDEPENAVIARLTPPDDGSLPTAHTCAENLAYIASVFDGQKQYHSYSYGVTGASIATQTTRTFRDYKDGVLLTTDFTHSSMIKSGSQTCTLKNDDGDYEVYFRTSEAPGANTLPAEAVWSEEAPLIFNERSYHFTYGLLPTELFNYIVNEDTIIDSEQIAVNPDGTYTQSFTLDPAASTYYYQFGMKTRGGLSGYPEFKSITFSVTFDGGWKILSSYMHEVANVNKGIVVESVSDFTTEYWYGADNFDGAHYSYYDSYYKKFLGDEELEQGGSVEDKFVVDVTGVLSNGFSEILNGGDQFEVTSDLGKNHYAGYVFLSLDLDDPLASLALKLSLGKKLNDRNLYIEYGNGGLSAYYGKDFALQANIAEVKYAAEGFGEVIKRFETAIGKIVGNGAGAQDGELLQADEAEEGGDPISDLMNSMVLVAGEKQAVLTLKTDDLLGMGIGINARLVFSINGNEISFRGATVSDLSIGGEKLDLSLTLRTTTAPEISHNPSETGADLADYVADVRSLLGSDLIKIGLALNGSDEAVKIKALKGINAKVNAYVDIDGLTVGADADVSYEYNGAEISAKAAVWYGYDPAQNNYGEAIVSLTELNGVPFDIRVKCDIKEVADAVSSMVTFAGAGLDLGGAADGLVQIVNGALSNDLSKVLTEAYADANQIKIGVSVDSVLKMLNLNLGMRFGRCALKYQRGEGLYGGEFSASLPALGFTLTVEGEQGGVEKPDVEGCLDVMDVVSTVQKAWDSVNGIINGQSLSFNIEKKNTYLSMDGLLVQIWGEGEISWKSGDKHVALDLGFGIKDGGKPSDDASLKLIYNANADGDTPLVRVALNEVGLDIYRDDIDGAVNGFKAIYEKIKPLIGGSSSAPAAVYLAEEVESTVSVSAKDRLIGLIFGVLSDEGWLEFLNNFTLTSDGKSVALAYLKDNVVKVSVSEEGDLNLYYDGKLGERLTLGGNLTVSSVSGSLASAVNEKIDLICNVSSTREHDSAEFMRLAYNFLFDAVDAISVKNVLGSETYTVKFLLNGANTNEEALQDVYLDVNLYFTGEKKEENQGKIAEADIDINVKGVVIKFNAICERAGNRVNFYINLDQVMDIKLPDLKFSATQDSLYETIKVLFNTVNDTNVIDFAGGLLGGGASEAPAATANKVVNKPAVDDDTLNKICDVLEKILNFNFSDALVGVTDNDGDVTASVNLNNILKQLGVQPSGDMGMVSVNINHNTHYMKTSGVLTKTDEDGNAEEATWISLSSELAERKSYENLDRSQFISIEFLPDLISDLVNFATDDNNEVYDKFTLSGTVKANVDIKIIKINLNVDVRSLTLAIDEEEGISFSGVLHFNKVNVNVLIANVTIPDTTVGITYKNGMLTLAKGITTATPEYKVMTFDYFIDHLLVKDGSVLQWWLDIDGWSGVFSILNNSIVQSLMGGELKITSGIENTEDVYLYDRTQESSLQDIFMKDFVEAIRVVVGGAVMTDYCADASYAGRMDGVENTLGLKLNDGSVCDYYGFSLNAAKVTNKIFDQLCAALLRTEKGVTGLKAYGTIKNEMVKLSVDLGYNEDLTEEYALGGADNMTGAKCAPDFYTPAVDIADKLKVNYNFNYYLNRPYEQTDLSFGCLTVSEKENYSCGTDYSYPRHTHDLTVIGLDGTTETISVKSGSAVYLFDNEHPVYTDGLQEFRLLYSRTENVVGDKSFVMNGNETVYAIAVKAVTVKFVNTNGEEYRYASFVGDDMPFTVNGMEAVDGPFYESGKKVTAGDKVPEGASLITLHGTFARTLVTVDGIEYQFINGSYTVKGRSSSGFNEKYVDNKETIYLESEIDGYPVTAIADLAFANTELDADAGNAGKPIYSIVVPATITKVGKQAFLDNVGMKQAVFLAPAVTVDCGSSSNDNDSKDQPFYGCTSAIEGTSTELQIYCNKVICGGSESNRIWTKVRVSSGVIKSRYYVGGSYESGFGSSNAKNGGGKIISSDWEYAKVVIDNQTDCALIDGLVEENLADGLHLGVNGAAACRNAIIEALNDSSAVSGFIDDYAVTVSAEKDAYGYAVYTVSVTIGERKHLVAVNKNVNANIEVTGEGVAEYKGNIYACGEISVTCSDVKSGYEFTHFTVNGAVYSDNPSFVAVTGITEISANLKANLYCVNLDSAIACDYDGNALTAGTNALQLAEAGGKITLSAPAADGYTFLGWAKEVNGALQFTENKVAPENGVTYYAIWGHSKVGGAFTTSAATQGSSLPAVSGGLNKWYDGSWNEVTQISKENTVVYTRHEFTVNYSMSGNLATTIKDSLYNKSKVGSSYSNSFTVLEGQKVTASNTEKKVATIFVDGAEKVKLTLSASIYTVKGLSYSNDSVASDIDISFKY